MQRIRLLALTSVLTVLFSAPLSAMAAPAGGGIGDSPRANLKDQYYDYQVWVAHEVTRYYVVAKSPQGNVIEEGFDDYDDAYDWASWLFFHDYTNVEIEERVEMSDWLHLGTWDTKAEAVNWHNLAIAFGYKAKIVPIVWLAAP